MFADLNDPRKSAGTHKPDLTENAQPYPDTYMDFSPNPLLITQKRSFNMACKLDTIRQPNRIQ